MTSAGTGNPTSTLVRDLTLNGNGPITTRTPRLLYGTAWKKDRTEELVYTALKNGFRGIDTASQAEHYDEHAVGLGIRRAIADGLVTREDIFVRCLCVTCIWWMLADHWTL
jgi:diketogulonate reductase-like aldo/keto reductase